MKRVRALAVVFVVLGVAWRGFAADDLGTPVLFQSAPGRFEVAAVDIGGGQRVVAQAVEAWLLLTVPLSLPESFPSPVFVRLVPAAEWREVSPFRVIVEPGAVVSVRVRWSEATPEVVVRRALVQGLLMRQAVARHGVTERLAAPLWLEHACIGWWRTRAEPAQLDALKQASERLSPPDLGALLAWQRGGDEPLAFTDGSVWLLTFLLGESGRAGEWPALLHDLLGGEAPASALAAAFPGRYLNERERDLWWQTGWHHLRRVRALPTIEAPESRAEIAELARFVLVRDASDTVVPLREIPVRSSEPFVKDELKRRTAALNRLLPALHPFYRNAALSLAEVLAWREGAKNRLEELCATFEQDWSDASELEAASRAALDALGVPR